MFSENFINLPPNLLDFDMTEGYLSTLSLYM